jgi:hypothetical protein
MISKKVIFFMALIGGIGISGSAYAEPTVTIVMEKTTYTYCEKLIYSIEVSEITGDPAIIHIRDETGGKSSAIPIPITNVSNPIPSLSAFEKEVFPLGKYFIDVQYLGIETTAEFNLVDSDNMCISEAMQPVVIRWINDEFTDGMLMSGFQNIVDEKLINIPFVFTEKNIDTLNIPDWVKNIGKGWIMGIITDQMFIQNLDYLIDKKIITFPIVRENEI